MQNNRFSKLSISIKSKGRFYTEKKSNLRSPYQRDRDRIVHSSAFRRLKHKTQVFVNTTDDHYRTRITHSMEVSQIARTLAKYFNLNEDLSETLSLAHDLGHTPFGHAGEEALDYCMRNNGGFDHNIQTIRIVTLLENKYYNFKGLNLTFETLDGLAKHNGPIYNLKKFNNILGNNFFKKKINFYNSPSLEAQIASISDDIAYNSHDLEDGLRAKLFRLQDLKKIPVLNSIIIRHELKLKKFSKELVYRQITRDIINEMVKDIILNTSKNIKVNKLKTIKDVYKSKFPLVQFSKKMISFDTDIKRFLKEKMYLHNKVVQKTAQGKRIIKSLFVKIKRNPKKYINIKDVKKLDLDRSICDFIAGMTDRFAINLYNKSK
ncbi:MAG: deoxyguanosinetriphosphate triphosphohydrolase [Candidatus Pelagibacter sp. TMED106]|nr:MAG: deoxyguanosinetriphosphate triphosphohydrolase [Candidatus Pelagibacter sp. TMED106]